MKKIEYLIIGGGPTGLGAACRLHEKGLDWHLLEGQDHFGGLASSFVDDQGFTWDCGGHVQFSHYETFDRYMDLALGRDGWLTHQRESWVWIKDRFVPYPFQNNLHRLDPPDRWACLEGLLDASRNNGRAKPENFDQWMLAAMGRGIYDLFLRPYNFKVWACRPEAMDYSWIGERVAVPALGQVLQSVCTNQDQVSWGPNRVFRFPRRGGTGAVWQSIGRGLPGEQVNLNTPVRHIDLDGKIVQAVDGRRWSYRYLISTVPLNKLIPLAPGVADEKVAKPFRYCSTFVVGIGLAGQPPEHLRTKCWMYFPEPHSPYYRVTVFSNYSPNNVAQPGRQWSLMTETSQSDEKPVDPDRIAEQVTTALEKDRLLPDRKQVVSVAVRHLPQGYPTPFLGRDGIMDPVLRAYEKKDVYSRGRFGAWKYEVANQDHSFAQGYECVERLVNRGGPEFEPTLFTPDVVNARKNP